MFTDYLIHPYSSAKHFRSFQTQFDYYNRRMIVRDGGLEDVVTFTTLEDFANIVVKAIEYQGEWPTVGGVRGTDISIGELIALGEKVRGEYSSIWIELVRHVAYMYSLRTRCAIQRGEIDYARSQGREHTDHLATQSRPSGLLPKTS